MPDRLPPARYDQLYGLLCQSGVSVCRDGHSYERLSDMRAALRGLRPGAERLSEHAAAAVDCRHAAQGQLAGSGQAARADEAANPASAQANPARQTPQTIATLVDDHHEF
jgi:hypothetical protein